MQALQLFPAWSNVRIRQGEVGILFPRQGHKTPFLECLDISIRFVLMIETEEITRRRRWPLPGTVAALKNPSRTDVPELRFTATGTVHGRATSIPRARRTNARIKITNASQTGMITARIMAVAMLGVILSQNARHFSARARWAADSLSSTTCPTSIRSCVLRL